MTTFSPAAADGAGSNWAAYAATTSLAGPSMRSSPFSIQMARSQMRATWAMEWETKSTVTSPDSMKLLMRASHFCWKKTSPTERVSSTMRTSGSVTVAMAKAMRATMPEE